MIHHDDRPYDVAATEAGRAMRTRLHQDIERARGLATHAIQRIYEDIPEDRIATASQLNFGYRDGLMVRCEETWEKVNPWALEQMAQAVNLRKDYLQGLLTSDAAWAQELAIHTLNEFFQHRESRHLLRSVRGEVRGFLSPRYQRRHPGQLLEGFLEACKRHGLLAYEAWCSSTRHGARAMLDRIIEPVTNEPIGVGVYYGESPYGKGATEISVSIQRMFCTNQAIIEQNLRAAHIGGNLPEDISWSEDTYKADTRLILTKIQDLIEGSVSARALDKLVARIRLAHTKKLDPAKFQRFLTENFTKTNAAQISEIYRTGGVEMLPPGDTHWRASNALSYFAQNPTLTDEESIDIQKLAGKLLPEK